MLRKSIIGTVGLAVIVVVIATMLLLTVLPLSEANNISSGARAVGEKAGSAEMTDEPMIIWYQDPWRDPNTVELVLKNGLFNHVMLGAMHKFDNSAYHKKPFVLKTIRICKQNGVKVIWIRWLYPGYRFERFKNEDAFDPMYYVLQIRELRKEAHQMGADFVAFDAEPNAKATMKALKYRKLTDDEFERMSNAVKKAVAIEGQVDFILPAGRNYRNHIYNATRYLGRYAVAEFTYYDRPIGRRYKDISYDIFGAYVNVTKENKKHPDLRFFKAQEILERQDLWAHKRGLFIYPGGRKEKAEQVAVEFSKITLVQPGQDSGNVR